MTTVNERYNRLRSHLNDLNYSETFGVDAIDLIERLLHELSTYKNSIASIKERENKSASDAALAQSQLFPLRKENAKLVRENNELHLDHIKAVEHHRNELAKYQKQIRDLSDEVMQYQMLYKATKDELTAKEQMVEKLRDAYEGLIDPALKVKRRNSSIKQTGRLSRGNGEDNLSMTSRARSPEKAVERDNMSVTTKGSTFTKSSIFSKGKKTPQEKLSQENQMKQVVDNLQQQLNTAIEKNRQYEVEINELKTSIAAREQELTRASQSTFAAPNSNSASGMFGLKPSNMTSMSDVANKRIIDQLNSHVDFLNEQLSFREAQIKELHLQIQESESLKMELNMKNTTLEKVKDENNRLTARLQSLEKKLFALGTPGKSPKPSALSSASSKLFKETMMSEDSLNNTVRESDPTPSTPMAPEKVKFSSDAALIIDLNKEIESLRTANHSLMKAARDYENAIANLKLELELKQTVASPARSGSITMSNPSRRPSTATNNNNTSHEIQQLRLQKEELQSSLLTTTREKESLLQMLEASNEEKEKLLQQIIQPQHEKLRDQEVMSQLKLQLQQYQQQQIQSNDSISGEESTSGIRLLPPPTTTTVYPREAMTSSSPSSNFLLESLQNENQILKQTIDRLQSELLLAEERWKQLRSQSINDQSQSSQLFTYQQMEEAKEQYRQLQQSYHSLELEKEKLELRYQSLAKDLELKQFQERDEGDEIRELQDQLRQLTAENDSYKTLMNNHEQHVEISAMKIQHLQQQLGKQEEIIRQLQEEKQRLQQSVKEKEGEVSQVKASIAEIDADRDQIFAEYESLREQHHQQHQEMVVLEQRNQELKKLYQQLTTKAELLTEEYQKVMRYSDEMSAKYNGQTMELQGLKKQLQQKVVQENNSSEDLLLMTKENQAISNELALICAERDALRKKEKEQAKQILLVQNEKKVLEVEKSDLLNNYRIALKEKQKLEDDIQFISQSKSEEYLSLQGLQRQVIDLEQTIEISKQLEEKWTVERASLLNQIELFTDQIQQLQKKCNGLEQENRRLLQEAHNWRQTNAMLNERLTILMKRATAATESNKVLTARLGSIERERDGLRSLIDLEREKSRDLMKIAEMAKMEAVSKDLSSKTEESRLENSKEKGVTVLADNQQNSRQVLPDLYDTAAIRELEIQRFKWNAFLSSKPTVFEEEWLWENRLTPTARDGPIKKKLMQMFNSKVKLRKQVKALVRSGVPPEFRGRVWFACSGAGKKQRNATGTEVYSSLLTQVGTLEGGQIAADIEKDLMRTFPDLITEEDTDFIDTLRRVLLCYALRNPNIGYCQSMNYICALLLFHLDEEKAFWTFAALLEDILPNNYYIPSLLGGRVDQQVFQSCIAWKLPRIHAAFKSTNTILEPIICPWFLCLYINVLPLYAVCRVWDCLFWEGDVVLFRIGLTMMKSKSNAILQATDFISIYGLLKANNMKQYSFELESPRDSGASSGSLTIDNQSNMSEIEFLIHSAFGFRWLRSVPTAKVEILRRKFTEVIEKEEEKRLKPRKVPSSPTSESSNSPHRHSTSQGDDLQSVDNIASKGPPTPRTRAHRRKSELVQLLLAEKDVNNLHKLALQMDEGLGDHVEEFAREMDNEDETTKSSAFENDSDDEYEEGDGEGDREQEV